ncbi:putative endopeptidase [Algoriphagus ratkowskyi]|uniref:M13 family metallopeptidase n=1 Tax=Algoriphagus ratkowskyi TaxID=57028 RepID=A0A2W7R7U6_9BACT|nr:M13 family metallopeptidase [Algoriphagus ratkowskyi]PZX56928.1 putative endopeptidase [Algoriphagus ratkowskyi]TXD79840.1 M13 family metallopeptidase [Algoriphagus ratkowskyi]
MRNLLYASLILLASCGQQNSNEISEPKKQFVSVEGIDSSIKPGDNFFMHVNGIWYDSAQIASDQSGVGSYSFLNIPQKQLLENILEEVSRAENTTASIEQRVGDFYASGMDEDAINQRGFEPIQPVLSTIEAINSVKELMSFVTGEIKSGNQSFISIGISPDDENSSINIAHFTQTGLGLPDRDYYFKTDSSTLAIQKAYVDYLSTLFQLTGSAEAAAKINAEKVYAVEENLAKSHKTRIERRVVKENYNKIALEEINQKQANLGWSPMLEQLGLAADSLDIRQPAYYEALNKMLVSVPLADWKTYVKAHTLSSYAEELSKPFEDASFSYQKVISGQSTQLTRAQQMVQKVDRQLGYALGQLYVKRYFNEDAKKRVLDLVNNLQKAFESRITQLDWMSDSTKIQAKEKLYAITKKIGYPDEWRTYDVEIAKDKYFENVVALRKDNAKYMLDKFGKAPDKAEWHTTPSTVTAYYNPSTNEIVFPAGILQYPYFDLYADDAINYGGIGMVIGHELTHAFDDQGAQYDKDGNVKNWWTDEDYEKFTAKTQQLIERYDSFTVLDSVHVKGGMTIGENTADNGALYIAYEAFKLTEQGQDTTRIDGFTPDQRFCLSIARIWRVKTRDEFLRTYVNTNSHSPAVWRVNGPLMNFDPFYTAFNIQPGDVNYKAPADRIKIW